MRKLTLLFLLSIPFLAKSQDIPVSDVDGVFVSYKLTKLKEDAKKDVYLITVKAVNKNDFDVFYEGPTNGVNPFLATTSIRNANTEIYLTGEKSKLRTEKAVLYYIKKGGSITSEKEVKINKGVAPIVTNEFVSQPKTISEFR